MKAKWIALLALLVSGVATACMGIFVSSQIVMDGIVCTYQLSNGQRVQVMYPGRFDCPFCLE